MRLGLTERRGEKVGGEEAVRKIKPGRKEVERNAVLELSLNS